jgi:DNA end-binding protein Ku
MPRAFWKGVISFGMVVIPIRMYIATESRSLSFHLLHKKCHSRPKQVLHCEQDGEYFSLKDTVRGYEYAKGQYLVLDEDDFKRVPLRTAHSIDIMGFVKSSEIDLLYFQNNHYIEPEELGLKPFSLLNRVLSQSGRLGLAKVSFQKREHLGVLRPHGDLMVLTTLFYSDEIISPPQINSSQSAYSETELKMAESLVEAMAMPFNPQSYHDQYKTALKQLVDAKLQGVALKAPEEPETRVEDLMEALKASLAAARHKPAPVSTGKAH